LAAPLKSFSYCAQFRTATAVNRLGEPDEVAHLVSYLASKEAGFITGESCNNEAAPSCIGFADITKTTKKDKLCATLFIINVSATSH
jgi:hypothetical protein